MCQEAHLRLLNNMKFLFDWISLIRPGSVLATALANRLTDLMVLSNPFELDGTPFRRGSGRELTVDSWLSNGPGGTQYANQLIFSDERRCYGIN